MFTPSDEGQTLTDRLAAMQALHQAQLQASADERSDLLDRVISNGAHEHSARQLRSYYAGVIGGLAADLEIPAEAYIRIVGYPVVPFTANDSTRQAAELLFVESVAMRGCSQCHELFFVNRTSSAGAFKICSTCRTENHREKMRRQRGTDLSERLCPVCSTSFTPKRSDARCCSAKCRAKLSRQEAKAKQAE